MPPSPSFLRDRAADGPRSGSRTPRPPDERVEAHLDGLRVAGFSSDGASLRTGLTATARVGETFAAAVLALGDRRSRPACWCWSALQSRELAFVGARWSRFANGLAARPPPAVAGWHPAGGRGRWHPRRPSPRPSAGSMDAIPSSPARWRKCGDDRDRAFRGARSRPAASDGDPAPRAMWICPRANFDAAPYARRFASLRTAPVLLASSAAGGSHGLLCHWLPALRCCAPASRRSLA